MKIFKKKKEKKLNQIQLIEEVELLKTQELLYIRNIVVYELRKRGVKNVWGCRGFFGSICRYIKGFYSYVFNFWYSWRFIMEVNSDFNAKLYVPGNISYSCCYTSGSSVVCFRTRNTNAYNTRDTFNSELGYIRYTDSVYIGNTFSYSCIENNRITHDIWYRNDIFPIMGTFSLIILLPCIILHVLFKRFRKR